MIEPVTPLSARFFDVERFTSKFIPHFKKIESSEPGLEERSWTIVESCTNCLDMLKAAILFNQKFPKEDKAEIRDIRNWLNANTGPIDQNQIVSALNYFFCGPNREAPPITTLEMIEAAYHFNNPILFERLKIEYEIQVNRELARKNLREIIRLLKELQSSSFQDDPELSRASNEIASYLGRRFLESVDIEMIALAYRVEGVPKLILKKRSASSLKLSERIYELLNGIETLREIHFENVVVNVKKLPRKITCLTLKGCSFEAESTLHNAPMGLKSLAIIECSQIGSDFFIGMPPVVEKLTITDSEELDDRFAEYLPIGLTHLDVSGCQRLSDDFLIKIPDSLKGLSLKNIPAISDSAMDMISTMRLSYLCLYGTSVTDRGIDKIPKTVTHLAVGEKITDRGLASLKSRLSNLIKLDLSNNKNISKNGISFLPLSIFELNLTASSVTDGDTGAFPRELRNLNVAGTRIGKPFLPIGLLTLNVTQTYSSDLNYLIHAKTLLNFTCNFVKSGDLSFIPRTVLCLTLDFSQVDNLDNLPPNLIVLNLSFCRMLKLSELSKVPKTIRLVDITDTLFDVEQAKSYLPVDCVIISGTEIHVIG